MEVPLLWSTLLDKAPVDEVPVDELTFHEVSFELLCGDRLSAIVPGSILSWTL